MAGSAGSVPTRLDGDVCLQDQRRGPIVGTYWHEYGGYSYAFLSHQGTYTLFGALGSTSTSAGRDKCVGPKPARIDHE
jgi:hypothetical protein